MPGTFSCHQLQRIPPISNHGMHHGTCVMHVAWCMSGLLTRGGRENVPGIPGACATRNFTCLTRGPWKKLLFHIWCYIILTHWGWVTHICISKLTIIGSDNGLSPGCCQAIIWTNAGIFLIQTLGTNFSEIVSKKIHAFSFKKMHLKMSSVKWRPFCLGLNELISFLNFVMIFVVYLLCFVFIPLVLFFHWFSVQVCQRSLMLLAHRRVIWQAPRQQHCQDACQISRRCARTLSWGQNVPGDQYHGCWCLGDKRSQGISNNGIDCEMVIVIHVVIFKLRSKMNIVGIPCGQHSLSISILLMALQRKEPGYQQAWYWYFCLEYFDATE